MKFPEIRYIGSFQRGHVFLSSDALRDVWRRIEREGTYEQVSRICIPKGYPDEVAREASLKFRQAVELRKASSGTSMLTRPLLLYYAVLNLVRGTMLPWFGTQGKATHGL